MLKYIFTLLILILFFFTALAAAETPVGIINTSSNNSEIEREFIDNIIKKINENEYLKYTEDHNSEQLILIINSFGRPGLLIYDITYVYSMEKSIVSYYIYELIGADKGEDIEELSEKVVITGLYMFYDWLNYISN